MRSKVIAVGIALVLVVSAEAANRIKIGFISTLSGPSAALGVDIRDGFQLAVKMNGGKLGGLPAEVLIGDDQFKPEVGRQLAERYVRLEKVNFLTGMVFSNIMFVASGMSKDIPLIVPGFGDDQDILRPVGEATLGLFDSAHWALDFDNAANRKFVAAFEKEYNRLPSVFASQGYDAALLIDGAVR